MFDLDAWLAALCVLLGAGALTWVVSVAQRNVTIVDSLWPLLFVLAAVTYASSVPHAGPRTGIVIALVAAWGVRLAGYLTWRNHGKPEDRRYQAIRRRNEPNFAVKSLYLVFGLQALLAAIISVPLLAAINSPAPVSVVDYAGIALWAVGLAFEAGGDWQLARFKADPANAGKVIDRGFWRHTRHPNYFGDFCVWWGFYLMALAAGGAWSVFGPALMTFLLLRVSGVALLEKDIGERRPDYAEYIRRTNAFFPGPRK
jgi:steroid 5-alpha reductase family enzyme